MVKLLVVTRGHQYDYSGFHAIFDDNPAFDASFVECATHFGADRCQRRAAKN